MLAGIEVVVSFVQIVDRSSSPICTRPTIRFSLSLSPSLRFLDRLSRLLSLHPYPLSSLFLISIPCDPSKRLSPVRTLYTTLPIVSPAFFPFPTSSHFHFPQQNQIKHKHNDSLPINQVFFLCSSHSPSSLNSITMPFIFYPFSLLFLHLLSDNDSKETLSISQRFEKELEEKNKEFSFSQKRTKSYLGLAYPVQRFLILPRFLVFLFEV